MLSTAYIYTSETDQAPDKKCAKHEKRSEKQLTADPNVPEKKPKPFANIGRKTVKIQILKNLNIFHVDSTETGVFFSTFLC